MSKFLEDKKEKKADVENNGISFRQLKEYAGGDAEVAMSLIEIFLKQVPESIQESEQAIAETNWNKVYRAAHKIKSSISVFKLDALYTLIQSIEENARDQNNLDKIPGQFAEFKKGCAMLIKSLNKELVAVRND
jgi:HPt (histidine-containing phosphotransfer) domain-containing protein